MWYEAPLNCEWRTIKAGGRIFDNLGRPQDQNYAVRWKIKRQSLVRNDMSVKFTSKSNAPRDLHSRSETLRTFYVLRQGTRNKHNCGALYCDIPLGMAPETQKCPKTEIPTKPWSVPLHHLHWCNLLNEKTKTKTKKQLAPAKTQTTRLTLRRRHISRRWSSSTHTRFLQTIHSRRTKFQAPEMNV